MGAEGSVPLSVLPLERGARSLGPKQMAFTQMKKITCPYFDRKRTIFKSGLSYTIFGNTIREKKCKIKIILKAFTNFKILSGSPLFLKTSDFSCMFSAEVSSSLGLSHWDLSL